MSFMITASSDSGYTQIPNDTLLHYIMKAGGDYIKVYLYLLMASQNPGTAGAVSVETLADRLEMTERDVIRILHYWERERLIGLTEADGQIEGITVGSAGIQAHADAASSYDRQDGAPRLRVLPKREQPSVPSRTEYTPLQIEALSKDAEMQQTLSDVEKELGTVLSPAHIQLVMYLICDLGFPGDLVSYLYHLASGRGKTGPRYIEAIAIEWAKKGIQTVEAARQESSDFSGKYQMIRSSLGLHRDFAPVERDIIDGWGSLGLSDALINEACKRTVLTTGDINLNYTTKILESWYKKGVKSLDDVKKEDEQHKTNVASRARKVTGKGRPSANSFQNFRQRDYSDEDYENMERMLLQRRGAK